MRRSIQDGYRSIGKRAAGEAKTGGHAADENTCEGRGHLLLVTCADPGRLDLLLPAAGRYLAARNAAVVIEPVTTRSLPAGGGLVMTASGFDELERLGALALTWRHGRRSAGYPVSLTARLSLGENVIAGAPQHAEEDARRAWHDISIIRLHSGTEPLRHRLTPHASFRRTVGQEKTKPSASSTGGSYDVLVEDCRDLPLAVQRLSAALVQRLDLVAERRRSEARSSEAGGKAAEVDAHRAAGAARMPARGRQRGRRQEQATAAPTATNG